MPENLDPLLLDIKFAVDGLWRGFKAITVSPLSEEWTVFGKRTKAGMELKVVFK